ncbi:hypothetical protein MTR_2g079760 [Medicago truncatula]|uniref:Uncharacterized protein n=1 Tax=Medicago truncatula TaxID=3880 RepID=A0A072V9Q6_MEDTR|nr:hypothetical protein MTR_2g079760 [Medicago truncatula]
MSSSLCTTQKKEGKKERLSSDSPHNTTMISTSMDERRVRSTPCIESLHGQRCSSSMFA